MAVPRTKRLNSLLKEVLSDVIHKELRNPDVSPMLAVVSVDITADLAHAKVFISIVGDEMTKKKTMAGLKSSAVFIGMTASKMVRMRHFPKLFFHLDDSVDKFMRIDEVLKTIHAEVDARPPSDESKRDSHDIS